LEKVKFEQGKNVCCKIFLDRQKTLTSEEFVNFQSNLQRDILKMEFCLMNPDENGIIKEKEFADGSKLFTEMENSFWKFLFFVNF